MDVKKIGQKIAEQRAKLNLTQTMFADKLNVSPKTVSKWENGRGLPSVDILPKLSKALKISIDELLGDGADEHLERYGLSTVEEIEIIKIMSPKYVKFTEPINSILARDWLRYILKLEGLTTSEFYNLVSAKRASRDKPKTIEDCVDRLLDIQTVTIGQVQRALKLGFSKAARIRDSLVNNDLLDKDFFRWTDRNPKKLRDLLTKELQTTLFKDDFFQSKRVLEPKLQSDLDFENITLINENFSHNKKTQALCLLKECSSSKNFSIESVICCFDKENLKNALQRANNQLKVVEHKIKSLEDFQEEIKIEKTEKAFVVVEAGESESVEILDLLALCNFECETEISLKVDKTLEKEYRITVFYV